MKNRIPLLADMEGWKEIPILESGEPLINLHHYSHKIIVKPVYAEMNIPEAIPDAYVRETVAEKLRTVAGELPGGYRLLIYDGWRPLRVQQHLYEQFSQTLRESHAHLDQHELAKLIERYVSRPNRDPLCPSPHLTGGAVDLTIVDREGEPLDMGSHFDAFTERSHTRFFEETNDADQRMADQARYRANRRELYHLMIGAGFTNYAQEWWHYDYGNQFWAKASGRKHAIYGGMEGAGTP